MLLVSSIDWCCFSPILLSVQSIDWALFMVLYNYDSWYSQETLSVNSDEAWMYAFNSVAQSEWNYDKHAKMLEIENCYMWQCWIHWEEGETKSEGEKKYPFIWEAGNV